MVEPGGRTRPLRCFSIRVLSSASWSLSDVDCIAAGIGRVENLVRKSATFYTKFIKLNKRGKKRPKFTPFVCLRSLWSKEPGRQVPIERHGRPRPCERKGPSSAGKDERQRTFRRHTCHCGATDENTNERAPNQKTSGRTGL